VIFGPQQHLAEALSVFVLDPDTGGFLKAQHEDAGVEGRVRDIPPPGHVEEPIRPLFEIPVREKTAGWPTEFLHELRRELFCPFERHDLEMIGLVTMQNVSQDRARKLCVYLQVAFRIGAEPERCGYRRNRFRVFYRGYAEELILVFGNGPADNLAGVSFLFNRLEAAH